MLHLMKGHTVESEIINSLNNINKNIEGTFQECCTTVFHTNFSCNDDLTLKIESVLDFLQDELNTGHWSRVPIGVRRAFSAANFIKALIITKREDEQSATLEEALKCIDMGLLLGAPLHLNPTLLTRAATYYSSRLNKTTSPDVTTTSKRCADCATFENLKAKPIETLKCPSLECFYKNYFLKQIPVKLQECIAHWPASTKWLDLNYLLGVAGNRTVPIEIGGSYTETSWTQKLMSFQDFIRNYYLDKTESVGYLAQHNLFDQIPELREDIRIPDYCSLSRDDDESEPDVNAWFGPKNTLSPLHYDPKDNLLAQVFGTKQIILYAPTDGAFLYPHQDRLVFNTAQVDPINPDLLKHPEYIKASPYKCLLEDGEILYIPPKWWHHVTALEKSFSVSFWWK